MTETVPIEIRLLGKVDATDTCWNWTGTLCGQHGGYGRLWGGEEFGRRFHQAHRISYQLSGKTIPDGLILDHLCRNTACVNPDHLEPVTNRENIIRGRGCAAINARKTHCIRGHEFTEANTLVKVRGRHCRRCHADMMRERRKRTGKH